MADDQNGAAAAAEERVRAAYDQAESASAAAMERVVGRAAFGELLAKVTENVVAVTKLGTDTMDLVLRNLRLAGRADVTRLARQLARTEDKLERVLQEVERLRDELAAERSKRASSSSGSGSGTGKSGSRS